jgi:hypothetical protein
MLTSGKVPKSDSAGEEEDTSADPGDLGNAGYEHSCFQLLVLPFPTAPIASVTPVAFKSKAAAKRTVSFEGDLDGDVPDIGPDGEDEDEVNYAWARLLVVLPPDYPSQSTAFVWIEDARNLTDTELTEAEKIVLERTTSEDLTGDVAIFEVASVLQDFLLAHNERPSSLFDSMVKRKSEETARALKDSAEKQTAVGDTRSDHNKGLRGSVIGRDAAQNSGSLVDIFDDPELDALVGMELQRQSRLARDGADDPFSRPFSPTHEDDPAHPVITVVPSLDEVPRFPTDEQRLPTLEDLKTWRRRDEADVSVVRGEVGEKFLAITDGRKVIDVLEVSLPPSVATNNSTNKSFRRLQEIVNQLVKSPHPFIVRLLGSETEETVAALKFRLFVEPISGTVASMMTYGNIDERIVRRFAAQLVSALHHLHLKHIVHRDIRIENVLVDHAGNIKLANSGIFHLLRELRLNEGGVRHDEKFLRACDVFDLAMTLLQMLGSGPHEKAIPEHLSDEAKDFLSKCLRKDWAKRPDTEELRLHEFVAILSGSGTTVQSNVISEGTGGQAALIPR